MMQLRRRLVKARTWVRLWIFRPLGVGVVSILALLGYLETQGIDTDWSGDVRCGGEVVCEGFFSIDVPHSTTNWLGMEVPIKGLCFGRDLEVDLAGDELENVGLWLADNRYAKDNPERFRIPFDFTGNCLSPGKREFKINGTKSVGATVRWGILQGEVALIE